MVGKPLRFSTWSVLRSRERRKLRRSRRLAPFTAGFLLVAVLLEMAMGERGFTAVATAIQDPASLFAARSPGPRAAGALTNTKFARRTPVPIDKALPDQPPAGAPVMPAAFFAAPEHEPFLPESEPIVLGAVIPPEPLLATPAVAPGAFIGPARSFVGIPVFPGTPAVPQDDTPPAAAVPEPAAWLMLILGFSMTGATLRRRNTAVHVSKNGGRGVAKRRWG